MASRYLQGPARCGVTRMEAFKLQMTKGSLYLATFVPERFLCCSLALLKSYGWTLRLGSGRE